MKSIHVALILAILFVPVGCGANTPDPYGGEPSLAGYVMDARDDRILVVEAIPEDFPGEGGVNAAYVSDVPSSIEVGQRVLIWFDGPVAESYPLQGKAGRVEVVPTETPEGAHRSEAEVLQDLLTSGEVDPNGLMAVQSIVFDAEASLWRIELFDIWEGETLHFEMEDR